MTIAHRTITVLFTIYLYFIGSRIAARRLNQIANTCGKDVEKLTDLAFNFGYRQKFPKSWYVSLMPLQIKSEIITLSRIIQQSSPKVICEVGTASGGTLFLFSRITNSEKIISLDLPTNALGGGYPWKIPFFRSLGKKHLIQLIRSDSHSESTLAKVQSNLKGHRIDLLFIDGDHTYQGVKQDFQMYSPLVRKGGIVVLHDIVMHDPPACEVDRFWKEIKQSYPYLEIIEDQNQKYAGIGLLYF